MATSTPQSLSVRPLALVLLPLLVACGGGDPYQGMDAETLYRMAEQEMSEGDAENAVEVLERLHISFGDWPRIPDAGMLLAQAHFDNDDYLTSRSEYRRFLDRFAENPRAPEAAAGECRALAELAPHPQRDQGYTEEAITVCSNVVVDYAGTPYAAQAQAIRDALRFTMAEKEYMNGNHYFRRRQYDSAIIYYQFVVDLYPETEFAPRALLGLFRSNEAIGYADLAEEARARLLEEYPDSPEAVELGTAGNGTAP
jgi:outer membrane protein assembly factor BamD